MILSAVLAILLYIHTYENTASPQKADIIEAMSCVDYMWFLDHQSSNSEPLAPMNSWHTQESQICVLGTLWSDLWLKVWRFAVFCKYVCHTEKVGEHRSINVDHINGVHIFNGPSSPESPFSTVGLFGIFGHFWHSAIIHTYVKKYCFSENGRHLRPNVVHTLYVVPRYSIQ